MANTDSNDENTKEYSITIIPIPEDGKVIYEGKDYTTAAKTHSVTIGGRKYYIRQSGQEHQDLVGMVEKGLEAIFQDIILKHPMTLTLTKRVSS
jgi:hypothetical protein